MLHNTINESLQNLKVDSSILQGEDVIDSEKRIKDLEGVFADTEAFKNLDSETIVYKVHAFMPEEQGTRGGLYFGSTIIHPGKVGSEYFMTRGHFHANLDTAEYYWGIEGNGILIFMDKDRNVWAERMEKGSLHYIQRGVAHRVANVGNEELIFNACWGSDAGHNYDVIEHYGFAARLIEVDGKPLLKQI